MLNKQYSYAGTISFMALSDIFKLHSSAIQKCFPHGSFFCPVNQ